MGLFSSIKNAISGVISPVSDLIGLGSSAFDLYQGVTGGSLSDQKALIDYQNQSAKDLWNYQKSNSHQLEVQDLRSAGLNPILSAGTASSANAFAGTGALSETGAQRTQARVAALQNMENLKTARTQQQLNDTGSARNAAEAEALRMNAESNRIAALAGARRSAAEAALFNQRTINEKLYPSNQPTIFKYLNSAKGLLSGFGDLPVPKARLKGESDVDYYSRVYDRTD